MGMQFHLTLNLISRLKKSLIEKRIWTEKKKPIINFRIYKIDILKHTGSIVGKNFIRQF